MASVTNMVFHAPHLAEFDGNVLKFAMSEPWYRTLPVSCITDLKVKLNGVEVPKANLSIELDGIVRSVEDCATAWDYNWFIQDLAFVRASNVFVKDEVEIDVHLITRIPYIMVGPTTALPHHAMQKETFRVVSA